jgi:hypothetical protein
VVTPGRPAFQLQKGEAGLSVFDPQSVTPEVTEAEILNSFRAGSLVIAKPISAIEELGLRLEAVLGDPKLPLRLQQAHAEILPGPTMTRNHFKDALKRLEQYGTEEFAGG